MRYAVVSDIHSNLEALEVVFGMLEETDGLLCLGDIVGYGPNPNECVEMIRQRAHATVLGNHDVAAIDDFGVEYFNPAARDAIKWTQHVIDDDKRAWLDSLGYDFRMPEYLLVHGAPKPNVFEYILDKEAARRAFDLTDAPLIMIGHTHVAEMYALRVDGEIEHRHFQGGGTVEFEDGVRYIVNVGSVGQPRDLNPKASFGWYEPEARRMTIVRFDYAIDRVQAKIDDAKLPPTLAQRLVLGR